jgi:hypothetical protein
MRLRCRDHAKRVTAEQPRPEGADPRGGLVNRSPQPEPGGPPLTDEAHQLGRVRSCRRSGDQRIVHVNAAFPAQDGAHEPHRLYHLPWPQYSRGGSSPRATDRSPIGRRTPPRRRRRTQPEFRGGLSAARPWARRSATRSTKRSGHIVAAVALSDLVPPKIETRLDLRRFAKAGGGVAGHRGISSASSGTRRRRRGPRARRSSSADPGVRS